MIIEDKKQQDQIRRNFSLYVCMCLCISFFSLSLSFSILFYPYVMLHYYNTSIRFPNDKKEKNYKIVGVLLTYSMTIMEKKVTTQIKREKKTFYVCL